MRRALAGLRYGSVATVHNTRVVQIECKEHFRPEGKGDITVTVR